MGVTTSSTVAATYEPIATTTLGSATPTITFNSFSGYTDLMLVFTTKTATNSRAVRARFNGDTGTNYSYTVLVGNGSSASSSRASNDDKISLMDVAGTSNADYHPIIMQLNNYANTTTYKTALFRVAGKGETSAVVALYRSTSAITSIDLSLTDGSNWASGNTATLWGIKAA